MGEKSTTFVQQSRYRSPWSLKIRLAVILWNAAWLLLFRPTPRPLNRWRLLLLRLFGCRITGIPNVSPAARITMPWNLSLAHRATLAPHCEIYNLGLVTLETRATVAQEAYICTGTHDFSHPYTPLITKPIVIGEDAFVAARAFLLPGVTVHRGALVGACAVIAKDVPELAIVVGNPARVVGRRAWEFTDQLPPAENFSGSRG